MSKTDLKTNEGTFSTGRDGKVTSFKIRQFAYTTLGRFIIYRLMNDRDLKMVITSSGNTTGTGKTTLAIILARLIHGLVQDIFDREDEWQAQKNAFMDVWDYLEKYKNANPGDILITDELEYLADNRRSMSSQNVYFSQAWAMLRYKNVVTIGTAPGLYQLDKRIAEHADIWINVLTTGRANTYYLTIDDMTGEHVKKRLKLNGYKESLVWGPLPEDDEDYSYLTSLKDDVGVPGIEQWEEENFSEADIEDAKRDIKRQIAVNLLQSVEDGKLNLTQAQIGEIVGYSQQNIYKIKREEIGS